MTRSCLWSNTSSLPQLIVLYWWCACFIHNSMLPTAIIVVIVFMLYSWMLAYAGHGHVISRASHIHWKRFDGNYVYQWPISLFVDGVRVLHILCWIALPMARTTYVALHAHTPPPTHCLSLLIVWMLCTYAAHYYVASSITTPVLILATTTTGSG